MVYRLVPMLMLMTNEAILSPQFDSLACSEQAGAIAGGLLADLDQKWPAKSGRWVRALTSWLIAVLGRPNLRPVPFSLPGPNATIQLRVRAKVAGLYFSRRKIPAGPGMAVDDRPPVLNWKPPATKETG